MQDPEVDRDVQSSEEAERGTAGVVKVEPGYVPEGVRGISFCFETGLIYFTLGVMGRFDF